MMRTAFTSILRSGLVAGVMLAVSSCATTPPSASCARVETLASYPHGNFLENLTVDPSGRVLFTSYIAKELVGVRRGAPAATFAALNVHPVSVIPFGQGYLVAAHGAPFTTGPSFTQTNQFLLLDFKGVVTRTIPAPDARFLNGMVALDDGTVLAADSILGRIWRLDPASGALNVWLDGPELRPDVTGKDRRPGVNGLKRDGPRLYVSNSFTGRIYVIGVDGAGKPFGSLQEVAAPGRIDDFVIAPKGGFYAATHTDTVVHTQGANNRVVLPQGGDSSTAVAYVDRARRALYVLTTGNFVEGGDRPARVLRVELPGGSAVCSSTDGR